jgi:2-polyprenyl-3-methyl-5-hydroxy-6-metoxy-1,4-benzoquinol methylase
MKNNLVIPELTNNLKVVTSGKQLDKIWQFRAKQYPKHYPNIGNFNNDKHDGNACILYSCNDLGELTSTARMVFDGPLGLPQESILARQIGDLRLRGRKLLQVGRFIIAHKTQHLLKAYYRAFYQIATANSIDSMVIMVKSKDIAFHQRMMGDQLLSKDIGDSFGSDHQFVCFDWQLKNTTPKFLHWTGLADLASRAQHRLWDKYARSHASVITSMQLTLYREALRYLTGRVVDCGCGSAKLAPLLSAQDAVTSYTGIDCSAKMVEVARSLLSQLNNPTFTIVHCTIENALGLYDSAVSIHSFYSWPDPEQTLLQIHAMLVCGGTFILATPNPSLDMPRLLQVSRLELLGHPDFQEFVSLNMQFAQNSACKFSTMSAIIAQVLKVGFAVMSCHQAHYLGGVNFLVLQKQ